MKAEKIIITILFQKEFTRKFFQEFTFYDFMITTLLLE